MYIDYKVSHNQRYFMFFISKYYFNNYIYPIFYDNVKDAQKNEHAVIYVNTINNKLTIMVIINFKCVIFEKTNDSPILIKTLTFYEKILSPTKEIIEIIKNTKNNAITVSNHGFIEKFSEEINKIKVLYRLSVEHQQIIWNEVLLLDSNFFQSNKDMLSTPKSSINNKWVD